MTTLTKKLVSAMLSLAVLTTFVSGAFAASASKQIITSDGTIIELGVETTDSSVQPRVRSLLNETLNGQQSYTAEFTCVKSAGSNMKFSIKNTGTSVINVSAYCNGEFLADYSVPAGETSNTTANKPGGLTSSFTFYMNAASSSGMYCEIKAEQY